MGAPVRCFAGALPFSYAVLMGLRVLVSFYATGHIAGGSG